MNLETSRFGTLEVDPGRILLLPDGLVGMPSDRHWVLLRESSTEAVGWLQSLTDPELALPVVAPQRFVLNYRLRIHRREVASLPWSPRDQVMVLAIVSKTSGLLTLNLRAPVMVNLDRLLGRQVVSCDEQPLQYVLPNQYAPMRQVA